MHFQRLKASNGLWSLHFLSLMSRGALMLQPIDQPSPVQAASGVQKLSYLWPQSPGLLCTPRTSDTQLWTGRIWLLKCPGGGKEGVQRRLEKQSLPSSSQLFQGEIQKEDRPGRGIIHPGTGLTSNLKPASSPRSPSQPPPSPGQP